MVKVRWLPHHEPEFAERVARIVQAHDWLTSRLLQEHGGFEQWTKERDDASSTGHWSTKDRDYRGERRAPPSPPPRCDRTTRTPNLPQATATLSGLTRSNATPDNIAWAVVEGMVLNLRGGVEALRDQGADVTRVLLIGGASASRAVRTIAPGVFGMPVALPTPTDLIHRYAALLAAMHGQR